MPIKLLMAVSLEKKIEGRVGWSVVKVGFHYFLLLFV